VQLDRFVVGAEADVLASGSDGSSSGLELEQGLNGSLRARAGIALDRFLLYGTGGVAATRLKASDGGDSDNKTLLGWTAGLGGEALVTQNVTARVEYRYSDYEDKTFTVGGSSVDTDLDTHSVRAGVGVKF
jgi:outer membrane immunogenic protein